MRRNIWLLFITVALVVIVYVLVKDRTKTITISSSTIISNKKRSYCRKSITA